MVVRCRGLWDKLPSKLNAELKRLKLKLLAPFELIHEGNQPNLASETHFISSGSATQLGLSPVPWGLPKYATQIPDLLCKCLDSYVDILK